MSKQSDAGLKPIATNRKAQHDYFIEDRYEAGIALDRHGDQVGARRPCQPARWLRVIRNGDAWLVNVHISPYDFGNRENHEPRRERRLLLHRQEIRKLQSKVNERGWTIVPLSMYLKGRAKVEVALVARQATVRPQGRGRGARRRPRAAPGGQRSGLGLGVRSLGS